MTNKDWVGSRLREIHAVSPTVLVLEQLAGNNQGRVSVVCVVCVVCVVGVVGVRN